MQINDSIDAAGITFQNAYSISGEQMKLEYRLVLDNALEVFSNCYWGTLTYGVTIQ